MDGHGDGLGASAPYGRIEYAYQLMAVAAGVDMAQCRLLAEGPRRHFMTRRFDRTAERGRVHLPSLCALAHLDYRLPGAHSYDQYLQTSPRLGLGPATLRPGLSADGLQRRRRQPRRPRQEPRFPLPPRRTVGAVARLRRDPCLPPREHGPASTSCR